MSPRCKNSQAVKHQEKASAEIRGEVSEQSPWCFLQGISWWIFWGLFPWKSRNIPPKNPRQNSNQNLGASQPESTLQGSGLDKTATDCLKHVETMVLLRALCSALCGLSSFGNSPPMVSY